jgi:hypothetical protein
MSKENQRYRCGPQSVVSGKIQAGVVVEVGDLVALVDDYVVSGRAFDTSGSGSGTIDEDFKSVFLGVLIEGATGGHETVDTNCLVATDGDYEYDIDPTDADADYPPGTLLGPVAGASTMDTQQLQIVDGRDDAIAQISRTLLQGSSTVQCRIFSSIMGNTLA